MKLLPLSFFSTSAKQKAAGRHFPVLPAKPFFIQKVVFPLLAFIPYEISSDSEGRFTQHKLEFTGMKANIVLYNTWDGMTYRETYKQDFTIMEAPDEPIYISPKGREA